MDASARIKANDTGKAAAKVTKKALGKEFGKRVLNRLLGQKAKLGGKAATSAGSQAAANTAKLTLKEVGKGLGSAFAVIGILATTGEILGREIADVAQTNEYDRQIRAKAGKVDQSFRVSEYLGRNPNQYRRAIIFSKLMKMTIADPSDRGLLRMELPDPDKPRGTLSTLVAEKQIKVQHRGAYVTDVLFIYRDEFNRVKRQELKGQTSGRNNVFSFPVNAREVRLNLTMYTGLAGAASKVKLIDRVLKPEELKGNMCFTTQGTTLIGRKLVIEPCR